MKKLLVICLCFLGWSFALQADSPPISIVLYADYPKTLAIRLNGRFIPNEHVRESLSEVLKNKESGVVVLMRGEVRFDDWQEIMGLLDKIGFLNVRYFVFSTETKMMVELDRHRSVPYSLDPPPRDQRPPRDNY